MLLLPDLLIDGFCTWRFVWIHQQVLKGVNKVIYTTEQSLLMQPYMGLVEKGMEAADGPVVVRGATAAVKK